MNSLSSLAAVPLLLIAAVNSVAIAADPVRYQLAIDAGKRDHRNLPVRVDIAVPAALKDVKHASVTFADGKQIAAQVTGRSLISEPITVDAGDVHRQLCFVLDKLDAGQTLTLEATIAEGADLAKPSDEFTWTDTAGKYIDLNVGDRNVLRYMYEPLDESTPERRAETYKVYHQVFDPAGKMLVTKGAGSLFPHHRGLFYGFNRISYGNGKSADTWHCTGKAFESHDGFVASETGPVLGRHLVNVGWHGQDGETFAAEDRELTVYRQPIVAGKPAGTLIEFASILRTADGDINLDGDPQHSGFQFRASKEVAEQTKDQTYYIRPDGVGKPGDYRNWPDRKDQVNFPWKGMSFVVGGQRFTVANLDRPENPKESRFSERDYGRFGSYFQYKLTKDKPLKLNYRIWLQPGEMTVDEIDAVAKDFTEPPVVTVKRL